MTSIKYYVSAAVAALFISAGAPVSMALTPAKNAKTVSETQSTAVIQEQALSGEWVITAVGSTVIKQDDDMPYIHFSTDDNRFYAFNGCNVINGDFVLDDSNNLQLMNTLMTMKMCPEISYEASINEVLTEGVKITCKLEKKGHESYLTLTNNKNGKSLTLRRHNMEFLNGLWTVKKINSTAVNDDELNIFFDIESLKVHGNTGCNYFNGAIRIDPHESNSINLSEMGVTRMACPDTALELQYLVALEETTTAVKLTSNTVSLQNSQGKQLILLERADIPASRD